jgi:predicted metal-dependent peptidase
MTTMSENTKMTEVKTAMLLHVPFFASILLDFMRVKIGTFTEGVFPPGMKHTAATDGKNIWFDEKFFESLKLPERVFVMCHEIAHAMWLHMARSKAYQDQGFDGEPFDHGRWNRAGDYVINDMLVNCEIGRMPNNCLHDPSKYTSDMMADDVYRLLKDDPNDGDGPGAGEGGTIDHHIPADQNTTDAEMKRVIASAADAAKSQGKLPGDLERFVEEVMNPKVHWVEKLRKSLTKCAGRDATTWTRPHRRRLVTQGVIMPSYTGFQAGHIVFIVDTSGSMQPPEMAQGLGECDNILLDCTPKQVTLIGCDARINSVYELYSGDSLKDNIPPLGGGGGTSFIPPFEWIEEQGFVPDCVVYFTDMYGAFPEDPGYPTIWCSTSEGMESPIGETIYVELDT